MEKTYVTQIQRALDEDSGDLGRTPEERDCDCYYAFDESWGPSVSGQDPAGRSFSNWTDVSKYLSELNDPQGVSSDILAAKAKELVSNKRNEFERIEAIGRYVQGVRYTSSGGAYKPRPASKVFAEGCGDCKDKANLMRTMLRSVGIKAWPVAINARDGAYIDTDWPSLRHFSHIIVAIRLSDRVQAKAVGEYALLGRLLFFDPTDEDTPVGRLPEREHGIQALIVAGDDGGLVRTPSPDANACCVAKADLAVGRIATREHKRNTDTAAAVANRSIFSRQGLPRKKPLVIRRSPRPR